MDPIAHRYAEHRVSLPPLQPVLPLARGQSLYGFSVAAREALDWWRRLRPLAAATGHWPLIMEPETPSWIQNVGRGVPEEYLATAAGLDGQALLARRVEAWLSQDRAVRREVRRALGRRGKWPQEAARHTFADLPTVSYGWYRTMLVTLFPVTASWQIPCLTGYGDWNAYPEPAEHAAVLRSWAERFGAHLLAMSGDTIEIAVERPPATRAEAVHLALEFLTYNECDYYGQSLIDVAAGLLGADVWMAWWD